MLDFERTMSAVCVFLREHCPRRCDDPESGQETFTESPPDKGAPQTKECKLPAVTDRVKKERQLAWKTSLSPMPPVSGDFAGLLRSRLLLPALLSRDLLHDLQPTTGVGPSGDFVADHGLDKHSS